MEAVQLTARLGKVSIPNMEVLRTVRSEEQHRIFVLRLFQNNYAATVGTSQERLRGSDNFGNEIFRRLVRTLNVQEILRDNERHPRATEQIFVHKLIALAAYPRTHVLKPNVGVDRRAVGTCPCRMTC